MFQHAIQRAALKTLTTITIVGSLGIVGALTYSACTPAREAAAAQGVGDVGACILDHRDEDPKQIEADCAAALVDIEKILFAYRRAAMVPTTSSTVYPPTAISAPPSSCPLKK